MLFKHFLATRFNVKIGDWKTTKNGEPLLNDSWMEDRFRLFETYCLPSVKNQSNQNFVWCIYFDINTTEVYKKRIKRLEQSFSNIRTFYIESINELRPSLVNFIKAVKGDAEYIITSRLDTDDLLHKDYINTVQQLFQPLNDTVIDLRSGYQLYISERENVIRNFDNSFNQFISLVEKNENVETIFSKWHKHWIDQQNIIVYEKKRLWIELVHAKNFINNQNQNLDYTFKFNKSDFGINGKLILKKDFNFYFFFLKKNTKSLFSYSKRILKRSLN